MRTIIKNPFLEFNMILFPIWVGLSYLIFKSFFVNEKLAFLIAMLIFGETHFASTYLFYFKKENFNYLKENINKLVAGSCLTATKKMKHIYSKKK